MYKDKDKQREANRLQMQRARAKGNTRQDSGAGNTGYPRVTDQDFTRLMVGAGLGHVPVSKPGDADYEPQCETTKAFVEGTVAGLIIDGSMPDSYYEKVKSVKQSAKRGKDIKSFEDY